MSEFTKGKWTGDRIEEEAANARLIAAAPEMYEYFSAFLGLKDKARELLACIDGDSQED